MNLITSLKSDVIRHHLHASQHQPHIKPIDSPLHVVVSVFNPSRSASRYRLFDAFREYVAHSGAILTTVELALGERHFEVTSRDNPNDVQVRSRSIMFHKENLLNIGWRHVTTITHPDAKYFCWPDADVVFSRPDWATETVHLLQTYSAIQMWGDAITLGADGEPIQHFTSFARDWTDTRHTLQPLDPKSGKPLLKPAESVGELGNGYHTKPPKPPHPTHPPHPHSTMETGQWHSGFGWAMRRDILDAVGGLGDIAILGSADHHMAWAMVGDVEKSIHRMTSAGYKQWWHVWQEHAEQHIRHNIGYMPGMLIHQFHGLMQDRRYLDRWQILNRWQFDPYRDVRHNSQGVYEWTGNKQGLESDCRRYFELRKEP